MKQLKIYLECNFATPLNTNGLGNPSAPTDMQPGSGDIPIGTINIKKKRKNLKDYLKNKQHK